MKINFKKSWLFSLIILLMISNLLLVSCGSKPSNKNVVLKNLMIANQIKQQPAQIINNTTNNNQLTLYTRDSKNSQTKFPNTTINSRVDK